MMSSLSWHLLAILLAAAGLGLLIGISSMRLHQARRQKEEYNSQKAAIDQLTAERDKLSSENAGIVQALELEKKSGGIAREEHSQLAAQQEALQVHSGWQAKRLSKMDAELHAAEEKCILLERDFASFKAHKLREVRMLKVNPDEWLDNEELPVLNKKVQKTGDSSLEHLNPGYTDVSDAAPSLDDTQPIIASELDIPSLAESELPDSVEELEFELFDVSEIAGVADIAEVADIDEKS